MIDIDLLKELYLRQKLSSRMIAKKIGCSTSKVNYWLARHAIPKRDISEAVYVLNNPEGDPFEYKKPKTLQSAFLEGLGVGLYWGEGNKKKILRVSDLVIQIQVLVVAFY